jgi:hypothetical protein
MQRAQKTIGAFFTPPEPAIDGPPAATTTSSKPRFGRPRDSIRPPVQLGEEDARALFEIAQNRRQSTFSDKMQERKKSIVPVAEPNKEVELAKQHGISVDKLQELLKPAEADMKTMLAQKGPENNEPTDLEKALASPEDFTTEFMHRCVNETAFYRLLVKAIMLVEFAASPAKQHTISPYIKKLLLVRPALAPSIQHMRDIRQVEAVDVTCINQYLEEHLAQSLLENARPQADDKQVLSLISRFTQQVVNLHIERCVQALPVPLMVGYVVGESPNSVVDPSGTWKRRIMRATELKPLLDTGLDILSLMHERSKPRQPGGQRGGQRRGNFAESVAADRLAKEAMVLSPRLYASQEVDGLGIPVSVTLPDITTFNRSESGTLPPRKPVTVTNFTGDVSVRRRKSTRANQLLVEAVDAVHEAKDVAYECQEHLRRQSLTVATEEQPLDEQKTMEGTLGSSQLSFADL